ncbi:MAG: type IV pilus secretin PilQ [Xanthomonadales bacterium]|nr:type IV pilus secretin PilQ [Xanthomonadales bacterium]
MKNQYINSKIRNVKKLMLLLFSFQVLGQNAINDVDVETGDNGAVVLVFSFADSPVLPEKFVTNLPPRLALDFDNTVNSSDIRTMNVGAGAAKGLRMVTANNKTRVVIDFLNEVEHTIEVNGNKLLLQIKDGRKGFSKSASMASKVEYVDFKRGLEGQALISVSLSDNNVPVNLSEINGKVVIEFANSTLSEAMDRKLDVIDFATPVTYVDTRQSNGSVKLEIETEGAFDKMAYYTGKEYTLEIKEKSFEEVEKSKLLTEDVEYTGNLVSFNFQDIPVRSVIQLIADASQLNIVVADNVSGNVTLRLNNVPWDQALDIVLQSKQLDKRRNGDVIWVAPAAEIAQREEEELEAISKRAELQPLDNIFIQVNYAKAKDLAGLISGDSGDESGAGNTLLSDRGSVTYDDRTNTLLVNDVPEKLKIIQELVNTLDRSVEQVQIEARIVVASEKFGDELGVRFGVNGSHEDRYGNVISTGGSAAAVDRYSNAALLNRYTSPSGSGLPTVTPSEQPSGSIAGAPLGERLNVNLPSAVSSAGRWAASILAADFLLDLELSALESEDRGEVISSPRVITANQSQAIIQQGVQIPYEQATSSGATSISFKDAVLQLNVKPLITPDERVDLTLIVHQDAVGEEVSTSLGGSIPSIDTRSVATRVLVNNGQTVVLGGIYEQVRRTTKSKVPVLGDIPGIGGLFRNKSLQDDKAELLIFVTPTIIKESL